MRAGTKGFYLDTKLAKAIRRAFGGSPGGYGALGLYTHMSYARYRRIFQNRPAPAVDVETIEFAALAHPAVAKALEELSSFGENNPPI